MKTTHSPDRGVSEPVGLQLNGSNGEPREEASMKVEDPEQPVDDLSERNSSSDSSTGQVGDELVHFREQLRPLLDDTPDMIYFKDTQSRFLYCNRHLMRRLGAASLGQVIGKTDFDFNASELANEYLADEQRIMRTGEPLLNKVEKQILPGGHVAWTSTTKVAVRDQEGKIVGMVGVSRDITALKTAEDALVRERLVLRAIIDNIPDCIYAKDMAGRKTLANPADLVNLRCKTEAEAVGKSDFDLFPKDIAEKFWADDEKVLAGEPVINREEFYLNIVGRKHWLLTSKLPLRDAAGKVIGLVGIGRDINRQKEAETALLENAEKLRQSAAQLERSNRDLQDFAYVASHDLQEPLRKVCIFSERLKEANAGKFNTESLEYLERVQKATVRMQNLINDLLAFSRVTTKAQPFAPVNLAEIAAGVVSDLEARIETAKGRVELGLLPVIDAEPLQMRQLLQNLIGNALKFRRPEEPPVVKVSAEMVPDPKNPQKQLCQLKVSDNCIGFEEKYLDRIFNVFQRLDTSQKYEGTGMGLAIVRKIALFHGGDITAKSKLGVGSTFIVTIPASHSQNTDKPEGERAVLS
jgi:two-component system sensor kinase FixL